MELLVNVSLQQNDLYNPFDDCWEILGSKDDGFGSKSDGHLRKGFDWLSNQSIGNGSDLPGGQLPPGL